MVEKSKNSTWKSHFYFMVISALKQGKSINLISKELNLKKQNLNYYIRQLRKEGIIIRKGYGLYEVLTQSKNATKYGSKNVNYFPKDISRGHAYIWDLKLPVEIKGWNDRIKVLESKGINFKIVGLTKNIPRIKVLGRKVWLCKDHLRIFDRKDTSYYGDNAIESRKKAFMTLLEIVNALESKLGFIFKPFEFDWKKEHYALIKNDLAIDQNKQGIIWRISDKDGEWLLIDDSLEQGGELENVGKKAFETNLPMQKWWNEQKDTKFEVTPKFILNSLGGMIKNADLYNSNIATHIKAIQDLGKGVEKNNLIMEEILSLIKELKK